MKSALERTLLQRWYGKGRVSLWARTFAELYRAILVLRAALYRMGLFQTRSFSVPVIVVGNFTVGGSGKTPLIIALAQELMRLGYRPGIVSRGYGRTVKTPLQVQEDTSPEYCGDEPKLIFERTGLPVFVDRDRSSAVERAIAVGCDLVLADDGLQHHRLARDIEIEVLDADRGYGNGLLLPAGPLRETPRVCDFQVVNVNTRAEQLTVLQTEAWPMYLHLGEATALCGSRRRNIKDFCIAPVHAVAGIGNPQRFFDALRRQGLVIIEHPFPDHHAYCAADFEGMTGDILMTEKDAVKCRTLGLNTAWVVPVEAEFPTEFFNAIFDKLKLVAHSTQHNSTQHNS